MKPSKMLGRTPLHRALCCALWACALWAGAAHGQTLKALRVAGETIVVGDTAFVEVELAAAGGAVWCGLRIDFGNGATRDIRVGDNDKADLALRVPIQYGSPGEYLVKVSGRLLSRGLRSASPCEGEARSTLLRVQRSAAAAEGVGTPAVAPVMPLPQPAVTQPLRAAPAGATSSTEMQLAELRAELARLQEELRQQQAELLRAQSAAPAPTPAPLAPPPLAPAPLPPPAAWSGSPGAGLPPPAPTGALLPPPGAGASPLPPPPLGSMAGPGSVGSPAPSDAASRCGPNPAPDCAAMALAEGIARLREVLRRKPAAQPGMPAPGLAAAPSMPGSLPPPLTPPPLTPPPLTAPPISGRPADPVAAPGVAPAPPASPGAAPAPAAPRAGAGAQPAACTPGRPMEPRDYAQPEYIGRPQGRTARMCFFRGDGRASAEQLNFYPNGHFVMSGVSAASGLAVSGAVMGTVRGTYGFQDGRVVLRVGYAGTGVTQSGGGAGSQNSLDVSSTSRAGREIVLPNCQRISVRQEGKALQLPAGDGHPTHLVLDGQRWDQMRIDCPAWQGWQTPGGAR